MRQMVTRFECDLCGTKVEADSHAAPDGWLEVTVPMRGTSSAWAVVFCPEHGADVRAVVKRFQERK